MNSKSPDKVKQSTIDLASKYLGIRDYIPQDMLDELELAYNEIKDNSDFKAVHRIFSLNGNEINGTSLEIDGKCSDFSLYTEGCHEIMLICATLSVELERFLRREQHKKMSHAVVLDATASAYLEIIRDEYIEKLKLGNHSFCFAPGYGDVPLELNRDIVRILQADKKIGVTVSDSNLFIPQKSVAGFVGIGSEAAKKSCRNCIRYEGCALRTQGEVCYRT